MRCCKSRIFVPGGSVWLAMPRAEASFVPQGGKEAISAGSSRSSRRCSRYSGRILIPLRPEGW
eukprot:373649-Amphidinium_carterae.1